MSFTITITEQKPGAITHDLQDGVLAAVNCEVFRQTVEVLDLQTVFAAINKKPRKPRESRAKKVAP